MSRSKRDELVQKALWLFYQNGFHATGMDLVAQETGVSKTSIYKHFRTKEELILAALQLRDENFRSWLYARMALHSQEPEAQLLAIFDAVKEWCSEETFQGCMFVKASAEYQSSDHAINQNAMQHKHALADKFAELADQAGFAQPRVLANQILVLKEGAVALAAMSHTADPADNAQTMAQMLLSQAARNPS